jgi:glyoxylase-like metal-dependent hydrolase (beta-lactamase superfamily II)
VTRIAPGIHRLGRTSIVNSYLLEESGEITIIDAAGAGYWEELLVELGAMGRSLADVRALVLTHAHSDHVGFAERIRRDRGVPVWVHHADAKLARGEEKPAGQSFAGFKVAPLLGFLMFALSHGMLRTTPIVEVSTFPDGSTLDVPGAPRVIHMPGHTAGMCALHVARQDALFIGDGLVTYHVLTGKRGPQISPFTADVGHARASLARIEDVDAALMLPGHGEPWTDGPAAAVRRARESVAS